MKKSYNIFAFLLFIYSLLSCNHEKEIAEEIKTFYNSYITVPMDSMISLSANGGVSTYHHSEYTYIMYIDSTMCSDCAVKHLSDWSILDVSNRPGSEKLKYLFIIAPKHNQYKHIFELIKSDIHFSEFTFIDTMGVFERANPNLPKNKLLHTFMINKEGKVRLIGNPITNSQIDSVLSKILYMSTNDRET